MTRAAIALGSNLDDPEAQVQRGFDEIAQLPQTQLLARSKLYRTAPVGYADQPDFINACALVETALAPRALLEGLLAIETSITVSAAFQTVRVRSTSTSFSTAIA